MKYSIIIPYRYVNDILEKNLINLIKYLSWLNNNFELIIVELDKKSTIKWINDLNKKNNIKHIFICDNDKFNKFKAYNIGSDNSDTGVLIFSDLNSFIKLENYNFAIGELNRIFSFKNNIILPYSYIYESNNLNTDKFISTNYNFNIFRNNKYIKSNNESFLDYIFIIKKSIFENIGRFDVSYHNNKYEKLIFYSKIKKYNLVIKNINGELVKLKNHQSYLPNIDLDKSYDFSIIINTSDDVENIEKCIVSIQKQEYLKNSNYEIIIGVNGCYDTLYKLSKICEKYDNLKIYMMKYNTNNGVVYNSLIELSEYENIITFNGGYEMLPDFLDNIITSCYDYDVLRIKGIHNNKLIFGDVFYYKKYVFDVIGGYENWEYLYNEDIVNRVSNTLRYKDINKKSFILNKNDKNDINIIDDVYKDKLIYNKKNSIQKINRYISEYLNIMVNNYNKKPISIILTAYQVKDYIEECLMSIENQKYFNNNDNYEVLIGVDHCQETLDKLLEIRHKYRNIRIFMMNENKGTYITTNTLLNIVKFDNIIRFDSDDIMRPNMISKIMSYSNDYNFIRFKYYNMKVDSNGKFTMNQHSDYAHGVVYMKKSLVDEIGGYQPWPCAADSELMVRSKELLIEKTIDESIFYRRIHDNSLTNNLQFGFKSKNREKYRNLIGKHESVKIDRVVNEYKEL